MKLHSVRNMALCALFAAVMAVCSQISIPLPGLPLTLQTFAAALCGFLLSWRCAPTSVIVWLLLGAAGMPVFSNFRGGFSVLAGPTGGFIIGFVPMSLLCGVNVKSFPAKVFCAAAGLIVCHAAGDAQFAAVTGMDFKRALAVASLPYLLKDAASVAAAFALARTVRNRAGGILQKTRCDKPE